MECNFIQKHLIAYQDNSLSQEIKEIVTGHVSTCENCRNQLDMLRTLEIELEAIRNEEPAPFLFTRMKARMEEQKPVVAWWQPAGYTVAASLVLGLVTGILVGKLTITKTEIIESQIGLNEAFDDAHLESTYSITGN
jgi:predicted anti-sigma-YlaC factor YlaD